VGTYGTITPLATFPKSRQQLFDVSVAGPIVGASLSLIALIAGLTLTGGASAEALAAFPVMPAALFHSSALIGGVTTLALPTVMLQVCATDCYLVVASTSSTAVACSVWQRAWSAAVRMLLLALASPKDAMAAYMRCQCASAIVLSRCTPVALYCSSHTLLIV
jgi:hypothetical protein